MKAVFVISGEKKTGKTQLLKKLIPVLSDTEYNVKGFYAQHDELNDSYSIKNLLSGEEVLLMTRTGLPDEKPGYFQISESGIQAGTRWLKSKKNDDTSILILDEIGYYELNELVWHELFAKAIESPNPLIFTTKTKLLPEVIKKWKLHPTAIFYPLEFLSPEKVAKQIIQTIKLYERDSF